MDPQHHQRLFLVISGLLGAVTLGLFWTLTGADFINYDDPDYVVNNPRVLGGLTLSNILWAFTSVHSANWHPLTWISHMLDCQLFGPKASMHHLVNVLLHTLNAILLFLTFGQITGKIWRSALVAALFTLHPLHVESVAWISERKDLLSSLFFILTLWAYARYVRNNSAPRWYFLSVSFFAAGLMSKPMLVTVPFILLLLDYWPLGRFRSASSQNFSLATLWELTREKAFFLALAAASSIITFQAQRSAGVMQSVETVSLSNRALNALLAYGRYLGKLFWPVDLSIFYPYPSSWPIGQLIASALLLGLATLLVVIAWRRQPYLAVGWFWFVGMLVPVAGLVQVGSQAMADRYTYLPYIGLFIGLTWGLAELSAKWRYRPAILALTSSLALVACATLTWAQLRHWKNSETLFRHALAVTTNNAQAHQSLGIALVAAGRIDEASTQFAEAVRCAPGHYLARLNLGAALARQGHLQEAIAHYQIVLQAHPRFEMAQFNLASVFEQIGDPAQASAHYAKVLEINPYHIEARRRLARGLARAGQKDKAIEQLQQLLRLLPNDPAAHYELNTLMTEHDSSL